MLRIHNSLTRRKEVFEPLEPGRVRMYVCGITVYDYCHIGHARMMVVFDQIQRWLRASGFDVTYVRNITDIDDKIIRRAVESGQTIDAVTGRFIAAMHEDIGRLGVQKPDHEPRATEYVPQMLDLIGLLERNGYAYRADDGDVNYAVRRFAGYGRLSGKSLDELRAGERVAVDTAKHDPLDFVLWKAAKDEDPEQARWPSAWGTGRPGWHIECSAMSTALLGQRLDIHGGGADLQFPHHENEIAQSEGAHGPGFVRYWIHNGFVRVDEEKMSKSLGNFFTIRDVLKRFDPEVLRLFILRAHYRSPLNYSDAHLDDARQSLLRLYTALADAPAADVPAADVPAADASAFDPNGDPRRVARALAEAVDWQEPRAARFRDALDDDFNTPEAIAVLFELATELNRSADAGVARQLRALGGLLGLLGQDPQLAKRGGLHGSAALAAGGPDDDAIDARVAERAQAKRERRFADADRIRDELAAAGIVLEDKPGGTVWRRG